MKLFFCLTLHFWNSNLIKYNCQTQLKQDQINFSINSF
nr:MAG TPA: hypothetical protein [Caudoviricetes sp.]